MQITSNYQLNFGALVPKSQYSGTPRLSRQAINEINKLKESIKEADKEIMELETNLSNPETRGILINYLIKRLEIFKEFRKRLANDINIIKEQGNFNYKEHYKMFKEHSDEIGKLEEDFAKASKNPVEAFFIFG